MNAVTMLEDEHASLKRLLRELDTTTDRAVKTRTELLDRVTDMLRAHETIEEEILYPALKEHPRAKDVVLEGMEEHNVVDRILGELATLAVDDETWGPKASVMIENIEHHIEEEEDDMFVKARQVFSLVELRELGERMAARRAEVNRAG
ncbi:MAG TPA: hemerythrin domain-containing protein [Candidatus Dormibacteraeota bacterium]|nr:hemerythrin domain-containing protein [Candidatus Dormibacteraeota bacterium]